MLIRGRAKKRPTGLCLFLYIQPTPSQHWATHAAPHMSFLTTSLEGRR